MKRITWLLVGTALMVDAALAGPLVTFMLDPPSGVLAGPQGTSVGWGYTITTDSGYLLINSITFNESVPTVGTFWTPGISSDIISSASPVTVPWILGLNGLQYDIPLDAIVGSQALGTMDLNYEWFDDVGLTIDNGAFDVLATNGSEAAVIAEVDVQQGAPSTVPEPGGLWLGGSAVVALILRRKVAGGN